MSDNVSIPLQVVSGHVFLVKDGERLGEPLFRLRGKARTEQELVDDIVDRMAHEYLRPDDDIIAPK